MIRGKIRDKSLVEQRNYRYAYMLWEFWKNDNELFNKSIKIKNPGLSDQPHCICFVFDGSMDEIPNGPEETQFYKDIIQMAKDRKYFYPQIVLTCKDKILASIDEEYECDGDSGIDVIVDNKP